MNHARVVLLPCLLVSSLALAERPRLGVMVIVDQLSAQAFHARVEQSTSGIKRLVAEGAVFDEARYESAPTVTSAGHATLVTGAWPETHGIVANEWFDGDTGTPRLSTEDAKYQVLGREPKRDGTAPTSMQAPTLSDSVRTAEGAKAVVISGKDRSAILCAGHAALALWFDAEKPFFTTSTFYAKELPEWVKPVNEALAKRVLSGAFAWSLPGGGTTGASTSAEPAHARDGDNEPLAERPENQASIDAAEVDVALAAVKGLALGADATPDLLTISFSGHDRIGHQFGWDSPEGLKEFQAVDKEIGRLLEGLDAQVGKGRYVVAFTADHGAPALPEQLKARGLDAGHVDVKALMGQLESELDAALGPADWVVGYKTPGYAITPKLRSRVPMALERLRAVAKRTPGVLDLLWSASLDASNADQALWKAGRYQARTADLIVVTKPYWVYGVKDHTGHSTAYLYDRAVPLIFFGAGVKKASFGNAITIDIAPTLARLMGVPPPASAHGHSIDAVFR